MSRFSNFLDVALAYTVVAISHAQTAVKALMPRPRMIAAPTIVEHLPPKPTPVIPVITPELLTPEETERIDSKFVRLHDKNYQDFERQFDDIMNRVMSRAD